MLSFTGSIRLWAMSGKTVFYTDPVDANPVNQTESLKDLVADMRGGKVDMLIILGGNPAYDAPADLGFADALKNTSIPLRVHLGLYQNETAELCQWHVNEAHYLEAWGDARAYDGTVSIVQPLIAPLYDGKSAYELVAHAVRAGRHRRPRNRAGLLAEAASRRGLRRHSGENRCTTAGLKAPHSLRSRLRTRTRVSQPHRGPTTKPSKSTSAAIPPSTTDNSPTTAGCRNCPSR